MILRSVWSKLNELIALVYNNRETWIHHNTPDSNRQTAEWTAVDESQSKRAKTQYPAGMVMTTLKKARQLIATVTCHNWYI